MTCNVAMFYYFFVLALSVSNLDQSNGRYTFHDKNGTLDYSASVL